MAINQRALAQAVGKSVPFVMNLQQKYGLPVCREYCAGYVALVKKLVYLTVFAIPAKDIKVLLERERRLLELLGADSVQASPDWFESLCAMKSGPTRLLLSGYDIGHELSGDSVQTGLDFSSRNRELFGESEMGSDVMVGLKLYVKTLDAIRERIKRELPIMRQAMRWSRQAFAADGALLPHALAIHLVGEDGDGQG